LRAPYGLEGGTPGGLGRNIWIKQGREEDGDAPEGDSPKAREINIGGKATIRIGKGDRLRIETPGGGGWGLPAEQEDLQADELERVGDIPGTKHDPHYGHRDTIYVSSVAVHPKWRTRGIGVALERETIAMAYARGYLRVTAHIRSSANLDGLLSRKILNSFTNWYQTGVSFDYVVLDLKETAARAHG